MKRKPTLEETVEGEVVKFKNHCKGYAGRKAHYYYDRFKYDGRSPCGTCAGKLCKQPAWYEDWTDNPIQFWPGGFLDPLVYDWFETAD